ncbi:jg16660 [Pararge aegeria aegeria]|uniref:Jg16660 protein n=1 Tax=Pararge aegeria aegeria TaxID=348720 RepID=A0A8S4RC39_9NEOP|nr:jg16660 [Pararge aegeria aegeria]
MSEVVDAPFSTVEINNDDREEEDLFASAVQEVSLDPEVNGGQEDMEKSNMGDMSISSPATIGSPIMEEIATERANNIIITITEPQKIGEGMSSYVAYRVLTKTNMPIFSRHEFTVLRRFSDFLGLHEKLTEKYLRSGRIIPPAPEKSIVGTTKLKMTSTPSTESANGTNSSASVQSIFVERRRAALERFLNRVGQHPVLCIDPDFREFLESGKKRP